jgi:hypothetical protein
MVKLLDRAALARVVVAQSKRQGKKLTGSRRRVIDKEAPTLREGTLQEIWNRMPADLEATDRRDFRDALVSPFGAFNLHLYRAWLVTSLGQILRRPTPAGVFEDLRDGAKPTTDEPPRDHPQVGELHGLNARRYSKFLALRKRIESGALAAEVKRMTDTFDRYGVDDVRRELAWLRVLEPLLHGNESGFVEPSAGDLEKNPSTLAAYLDARATSEAILIEQGTVIERIQAIWSDYSGPHRPTAEGLSKMGLSRKQIAITTKTWNREQPKARKGRAGVHRRQAP